MSLSLPPLTTPVRMIGGRRFDFAREIAVMAIVNRTPDSFYDGGRTYELDRAVESACTAAAAGADWVDIGGVPFSPDTPSVGESEELDRVLPVITETARRSNVVISVDTVRPEVARQAVLAGAAVINDTSGLHDHELAEVVAESGATLVITHSLAAPGQHLRRPRYDDIVTEVRQFLADRVNLAMALGVPEERIVIDPGHDLNKNTLHSLELTRRMDEIAVLGLPLLAAVSNKDFIGEATGLDKPDRLAPSIAAATICVWQGARILRMHDPAAATAAATMIETIAGFADPQYLRHNLD
ncbi:dihydropteroate synthase [Microlunatus speluncae]|uniref:dihydropteroate synthase n=1 Tax=Microlunatus speluncae TaxID=2594267 RepID=UPI0012663A00|nr:dihydropteroate synthase [Microlunatus speluncae]